MKCTVENSTASLYSNVTVSATVWPHDIIAASTSASGWYIHIEDILYNRVILTICIVGVLGNLLNLAVLTHKCFISPMDRMEKSAHMGLVALAVSDLLFCVSALPHSLEDREQFEFESVNFTLLYRIYGNGFINIFIMSSTWLTVVMAMCRYLAICFPIRGRQLLGKTFTAFSIVAVYTLCVLFNLPRFWMTTIGEIQCSEGWSAYYGDTGALYAYPLLEQAYMWMYCAFCILIPLMLLAYCNVYLIQALQSSNRLRQQHSRSQDSAVADRNHTLTLILTVIVIFCICLVTPAELLNFTKPYVMSSAQYEAPERYNLAVAFCNTLQAINFAFNFILYCAVNVHFRHSIKLLCGWKGAQAGGRLRSTWTTRNYTYASASVEEMDTVALNTCSTRL